MEEKIINIKFCIRNKGSNEFFEKKIPYKKGKEHSYLLNINDLDTPIELTINPSENPCCFTIVSSTYQPENHTRQLLTIEDSNAFKEYNNSFIFNKKSYIKFSKIHKKSKNIEIYFKYEGIEHADIVAQEKKIDKDISEEIEIFSEPITKKRSKNKRNIFFIYKLYRIFHQATLWIRRLFKYYFIIVKSLRSPKMFARKVLNHYHELTKKLKFYCRKYVSRKNTFPFFSFVNKRKNSVFNYPIRTCKYDSKLTFKTHKKIKVSIIIPVFNQWRYTFNCIKSISLLSDKEKFELIIADDGSSDKTLQAEKLIPGIRVIKNKNQKGFLHNCNYAAQYANGEYLFFLNNDTALFDKSIDNLVKVMDDNPDIGMAGARLFFADHTLQEAGGIVWNDATAWNYGRGDNVEKPEYNYMKDVDYISGAAIMVRRKLWKEIGGFDPRYAPAYYEDTDLAFEIRKRGFRVVLQPKSMVMHFEGKTHGTSLTDPIKSFQVVNRKKFWLKWKDTLRSTQFSNGTNVFFARDRSRHHRHIFIIDHALPTYDRDAGSRSMWTYINLLITSNYKIIFMADNSNRIEPYASELENLGVEVWCDSFSALRWKERIVEIAPFLDFILLSRPNIAIKYIDFFSTLSKSPKIVYYGHDIHHQRMERSSKYEKKPPKKYAIEEIKEQEYYLWKKSDFILYPSTSEIEYIDSLGLSEKSFYIPLYSLDDSESCYSYLKTKRENVIFIGNFLHLPNLDGILWFIDEVFPKLSRKDIKVLIVGPYFPKELLHYKSDNVKILGEISDKELDLQLSNTRLMIAPLRYGAGVKGKVLQGLHKGIVVVGTSMAFDGIPEVDSIVSPVDSPDEMANIIDNLYSLDNKSLEVMSKKQRNFIKNNFNSEKVLKVFDEIYLKSKDSLR
ncbi:MAG: hypothetical protein CSA34_06275 [Desulfobulbus propionicus]|nr:MAG: hypothetical protein CSA34_06275 [Desulfobulbus propionicus]